jgi:hypothetical protein
LIGRFIDHKGDCRCRGKPDSEAKGRLEINWIAIAIDLRLGFAFGNGKAFLKLAGGIDLPENRDEWQKAQVVKVLAGSA